MKKQLLASLLSLLLVGSLTPMATASTSSSCSGVSNCTMDKSPSCPYKVLTKEECQRFCKAKAAAIAKDPSLAKPENRCKLCRAIIKADPSMKPICMKMRKNCRKMKKHCTTPSCDQSTQQASSSQQSANATSSSAPVSTSVASQSAPASSTEQSSTQQSSSASSAN